MHCLFFFFFCVFLCCCHVCGWGVCGGPHRCGKYPVSRLGLSVLSDNFCRSFFFPLTRFSNGAASQEESFLLGQPWWFSSPCCGFAVHQRPLDVCRLFYSSPGRCASPWRDRHLPQLQDSHQPWALLTKPCCWEGSLWTAHRMSILRQWTSQVTDWTSRGRSLRRAVDTLPLQSHWLPVEGSLPWAGGAHPSMLTSSQIGRRSDGSPWAHWPADA